MSVIVIIVILEREEKETKISHVSPFERYSLFQKRFLFSRTT